MFAILFTEAMDPFYKIIGSFPTAVFTLLIFISVIYWFIAMLGLIDLDFLHIDVPDGDLSGHGHDGDTDAGPIGGILFKLKLTGVPIPISFTLLSVIGWIISYYSVYFLFDFIPTKVLQLVAGCVVLAVSFYVAALITSVFIRPLKKFFDIAEQQVQKKILGQTAIVRTSRVDKEFGEATLDDGGAGLIVKVRSYKEEVFQRGDRIVLIELLEDKNIYKVISEKEFTK